jgi:hypothetical protein
MPRERILITVKTYPTLSQSYGELVCTAGVREDGSWVRLYPIPFRLLDYENRYHKFDWIETTLVRNSKDPRPETYRPVNPADLSVTGKIGTEDGWRARRTLLLEKCTVYTDLQSLIHGAHENKISLAVFKPVSVKALAWEECERGWDAVKLEAMKAREDQGELFSGEGWKEAIQQMPKLPYKFFYRFSDSGGKESRLQILDWEIGQLYWNCLKYTKDDELAALEKVRQKYFDEFLKTDLHFFLGTTQQYHGWAANPWQIIGVLPLPHQRQIKLF